MPSIKTMRSVVADKVYRDMEKGSELRAQLAAEAAGCSVSEMSSLKITNLNDRRDAEIAAVRDPAAAAMETHMAELNQAAQQRGIAPVFGFNPGSGAGFSGAVAHGPGANAGARMRTVIQANHSATAAREIIGRDAMTGLPTRPASNEVTSERHANEVYQPGYRRRG